MLFGLLLTLGVAVLSVPLRSYQPTFAQKLGALGVLIASFLAVYFITGNAAWGVAGAASWLFLPWLEILTRIRTLRLPKEKRLRPKNPPSNSLFPALDEISREIENEGFAHVNDAGWDWEDYRQFFRLFYKTDDRDEERMQTDIENDLREQIAHNVRAGVLKPAADDEVKYSWRGMIYLWCQFLLDLVRL